MRGHDILDPSEPVQAVFVQPVAEGGAQTDEVEGVKAEEAQAEATGGAILNPQSLGTESGANNVENLVNVPFD